MTVPPSRPRANRRHASRSVSQTMELAIAARAAGQLGESFAACTGILDSDPKNADALLCLSQIARDRGDADAALDFIAAACRNAPDRGELFLECARVHIARGDLVEAELALRDAVKRDAGIEALLALSDLLSVERRFDEACAYARAACALGPASAEAHQRLAAALRGQDRMHEAAATLVRAVELDPADARSHHALGSLWITMGNSEAAAGAFRRCVALDPIDRQGARAELQRLARAVPSRPEHADNLKHARRLRCLVERNLGPTRRKIVAVELGCGHGAAGAVWRPVTSHLIAVEADDASASTARMTGLYDMVTTASPAQHLAELPCHLFDIVAAPVALTRSLALSPFFSGAARALRSGGLFALAVHADARGAEVTILPGQRFRHSPMYLRRLAEAYGFETVAMARLSDRPRGGDGNTALLAVFRNGSASS